MTDQPIACTLPTSAYADRLELIRRVGADALVRLDRHADRAELRFLPGDQIARDLRGIRDAEGRCCAFLRLELIEEPGGIVLCIASADPEGAFMIDELANAFVVDSAAPRDADAG